MTFFKCTVASQSIIDISPDQQIWFDSEQLQRIAETTDCKFVYWLGNPVGVVRSTKVVEKQVEAILELVLPVDVLFSDLVFAVPELMYPSCDVLKLNLTLVPKDFNLDWLSPIENNAI